MFEIEYSDLLFEISSKIGVNQLERLVFMCRKQITKGSERTIQNALELFEKLEKWDKLGINRERNLKSRKCLIAQEVQFKAYSFFIGCLSWNRKIL
ncbi:unnamed protein product [Pocillopora meandrina]|uniref:DED domain-containing protein n=1 Tax=Pocillopora meandrina TaxID=46732 RepID=A0AAU9XI91_9CNID|nr:unnamed protein product [Pocillopora meandrina]